ncbi:ABC transporter ATP-binding protein [Candidatus Micrarchaeota archaeon]|nr:ABC transporter ATP-binding protein [Candidatus Micrarchaeota archaeon]MBU1930296.1 ABC transporter ATP-binding protein [Candidatus Micrarchaeota archaeon]
MGGSYITRKTKQFVSLQGIHYAFPDSPFKPLLRNLHFNVQSNEFVVILGPSGIGKTTVLRLLAGLIAPTQGTILVNNQPVLQSNGKIGLVFQHYTAFPWLSVEQNIEFGLKMQKTPKKIQSQKVNHLLEITKLTAHKNQFANLLSGGQKQRVALARTLALEPALLLLDEPFGALDSITRQQLQQYLLKLQREFKPTTILVTHDIEEALFLSDRIFILQKQPATITAVINNPFSKPRDPNLKATPAFQKFKQKIAKTLTD